MFRDRYKKIFIISGFIIFILLFFFLWSGNICRKMIKSGDLSLADNNIATTAAGRILSKEENIESGYDTKNLYWNGKKIVLDVADSDAKRELGLSGREKLLDNTGMIFIFDQIGRYGFWMKDMKFALDILWLDNNMKILEIRENILPDTYPQVFMPTESSRIVLELPAGYCAKNKIKVGDSFSITLK